MKVVTVRKAPVMAERLTSDELLILFLDEDYKLIDNTLWIVNGEIFKGRKWVSPPSLRRVLERLHEMGEARKVNIAWVLEK
jgi:formylmethanofuran dehydrogenase subunit B